MIKRVVAVITFGLFIANCSVIAQSWSGPVNGQRVTISGQPGATPTSKIFKVYFNGDSSGSVILRCGQVSVDSGSVLFCSDNLNEFADRPVSGENYFNLRFASSQVASSQVKYVCKASTGSSPLFCQIDHPGRAQEFRLDLVR
jgi:hypothetical protein